MILPLPMRDVPVAFDLIFIYLIQVLLYA